MRQLFGRKRAVNKGLCLISAVMGMGIAVAVGQHALHGEPILARGASDDAPATIPIERGFAPALSRVSPLPAAVRLDMPFTPQAPYGDWSDPYGEACEEASVIMAMAWVRGNTLNAAEADAEILRLVEFENYYFGYSNDTALRETVKLITNYYHYPRVNIFSDPAIDDIRRALAAGNIVILPVAGALLLNPDYLSPPPYHMLVVKGYDDETREFIVNDPGTRHGEGYRYPYDTLLNAVHDWTGSDDTMLDGRKGMITVAPQDAS